jgi:glycosyltransferase involved in cell wall biosynthesis
VRPLARAIADFAVPPIAITTLPIVADLVGVLPVRRWVYYCVDDFSQWPGLDQAALAALDEELIRKADVLIAVSENLQKRLAERGRPAPILTHGVDLDFWRDPGQAERLEAVANLERPLVVFWGVLDRRMDVGYVRQLSQDLERGTVVLVGPRADPEPALLTLQRVVHLPPLPFEQLPLLAREAQVLIMPYADLPVTRAMQPLKLKEYLATSRPVVVTDLPANREWADCLDIATQPEAFSGAVRQRLASGLPADQRAARRRLGGEGWQEKARLFAHWAFPEGASNGS